MVKYKTNWLIFLALIISAFLLLGSWLSPTTGFYWDELDFQAFYFLNGWVAENQGAQIFWAIANVRPFDLLPVTIILVSVLMSRVYRDPKDFPAQAVLFLMLIITMFAIRYIVGVLYGVSGRASPSVQLDPVYFLTRLVPSIPSKDFALDSFPSDHAAVMLTWMGFMLIYAKKLYRWLAVILALFFSLPRLVSGAHWISDIFVGSLFVTLLSIALVCFTPVGRVGVGWIMKIFEKISCWLTHRGKKIIKL